ncbi:MAG: ribosomal RNA small subunit methyltransferase A [Deltaproteobacteria bacterium]|nr:ribosomal RNA small subunit methyltransferase A [Deltaproteobacteria bacterium]
MMEFRPKKRLSQNFLIDKNIARKIVSIADPCKEDVIIEIGPGTGILTHELVNLCKKLICIELDKGLSERLGQRFSHATNIEVITADALKVSFLELAKGFDKPFKLVSNLPYHISGPMLAKLLEERKAFSIMVLMFQKELAKRITAGPGSKDYSPLSILTDVYTDASIERIVPARVFMPVPKVDSAVIRLTVLKRPSIEIQDEDRFKRLLKAAFSTRRKTIRNSLSSLGISREDITCALDKAGIAPCQRAETISAQGFARLLRAL